MFRMVYCSGRHGLLFFCLAVTSLLDVSVASAQLRINPYPNAPAGSYGSAPVDPGYQPYQMRSAQQDFARSRQIYTQQQQPQQQHVYEVANPDRGSRTYRLSDLNAQPPVSPSSSAFGSAGFGVQGQGGSSVVHQRPVYAQPYMPAPHVIHVPPAVPNVYDVPLPGKKPSPIAPSTGLGAGETWIAVEGADVKDTLGIWARQGQVDFYWSAGFGGGFEVLETAVYQSSFEEAVRALLDQYSGRLVRPVAQLYRSGGHNGDPVLVVEASRLR